MIDISFNEITIGAYWYCFFMFFITALIGLVCISKTRSAVREPFLSKIFLLLMFVMILTSFDNLDYFGYRDIVARVRGNYIPHMEPWYGYIAAFVDKNYILFRAIVWGGSIFLCYYTAKMLNLPSGVFMVFLFVAFWMEFHYSRATAAMSVYFLGVSLLLNKEGGIKFIKNIIGVIIILISLQFHKSMALMIPLTIILLIPSNKKILVGLLIQTPILIIVLRNSFVDLLTLEANNEQGELIINKFNAYSEREMASSNWKGMLANVFSYARYYVLFYFITKSLLRTKMQIPNQLTGLYKIVIGIMLVCHSLLFLSSNSYTLYYRYLYMSMIPMSLIWVGLFKNSIIKSSEFNRMLYFQLSCSAILYFSSSFKYL